MYGQKLCIATSSQFGISEEEQIALFKKIGFEGFFCDFSAGKDLSRVRKIADENGMYFQSVHAPFVTMAHLWQNDEQAEPAKAELIECVEKSAAAGVPIVVMHAFIGFEDHTPTEVGLENIRPIVKRAGELGVKLAFENTEGEEYLTAIMEEFRGEKHVGFCWDTGHEMCYNYSKDMLALYGDRLFCTHLNDNLGIRDFNGEITWIDDLHLLPFDGAADWEGIADRLNACGFFGELTFELNKKSKPDRVDNDAYDEMPLERYLNEAYKRACKFAAMKLSRAKKDR